MDRPVSTFIARLALAATLLASAAASAAPPAPVAAPAPPAPPIDMQEFEKEWMKNLPKDWKDDKSWKDFRSGSGEAIDERRPLKQDARVHVSNTSGSVEVTTWDRSEIYVSGELGRGAEKLDISGSDSNLEIVVRNAKGARNSEGSDLRILLPASVALNIDAVSADIVVQGVRGKVVAASVSGDVTLSLGSEEVDARSVSGDVVLRAPTRICSLNSISGDIRASGPSGRLKLETVSGDAELVGGSGSFSDLNLKSISGDFTVDGALSGDGRLVGETLSGEMHLRLPASTSATVNLHTFSGEVRSAFGEVPKSDERREQREFKIGDGRARIELSSFSGDIRLEKR